ncbi:tail fiber domain-containing protein, partial [Gilvibacter sp.]|uniref:tail fiber domain-containing protein n=1 Tax=Gilvibacter sp. TaxID=2729997 RepID=UPI0025BB8499
GLSNNTSGNSNTAIGSTAMINNTTGSGNTAIGRQSLAINTSGNDNTMIGFQAGLSNSTGSQNTGMGSATLDANTTGIDNTAVGYAVMGQNNIGSQNTAVGRAAMNSNTEGIHNTAIGANALFGNIFGEYNIAIGSSALFGPTTGDFNIAIGRNTMSTAGTFTAAQYNIALGDQAMSGLTSGSRNIGIGGSSLTTLTTGIGNVGVGMESLEATTTAQNNTALGYRTGMSNTDGESNTFIGARSGENSTRGSNNVFLGANAGFNNGSGSDNVFLGFSAGLNETGSNLLYIANSNTSSPLIWGDFSASDLRINGQLQVGNPSGTGYEFPATDGTLGEVLRTDGAGNVFWANISTGTDDQTIETFSFNAATEILTLEIEDDGVAARTVDLSSLDTTNALDGAYDEGGAGAGRTITADNGAVTVAGSDGLLVTGTFGSGSTISVSGAGDRMFFNPRKAAFRAGTVGNGGIFDNTAWDDANVGNRSFAVNAGTIASASYSFASGLASEARGVASTAMGYGTIANDDYEMAVGEWNTVTIGRSFVVGNGTSDVTRSDSFEVFTDGRVTINEEYTLPTTDGSSNQVLTTNGFGTAFWSTPSFSDATTASNGLSESSDDIQLGGSLSQETTITYGANNFIHNLDGSGYFEVQDEGTAKFRVSNTGNTRVGGDLQINQTDVMGTRLIDLTSTGSTGLVDVFASGIRTTQIAGTGDTYFNGGSVGIGITNPTEQLDVSDNTTGFVADFYNESLSSSADGISIRLAASSPGSGADYIGFRRGGSGVSGRISGTGSGIQLVTTSDRRLKTNFEPIANALDMISDIEPQWYEFKSNLGFKELGFIAQEVKEVFPQIVTGDESSDPNEDPMMVDYARITPLLTAGIKELHEKVKVLEAENAQLKAQLDQYAALEARIAALEGGDKSKTSEALALSEE